MDIVKGLLPAGIAHYLPQGLFKSPERQAAAEVVVQFLTSLEHHDITKVRLILDNGLISPNVTFPACDGKSPLHIACGSKHLNAIRALLEHGADATARDKNGTSVLMRAASKSSPEIVKELLQSNPNLMAENKDLLDYKSVTMLQYALYGAGSKATKPKEIRDAHEVLEILLAHGAGRVVCRNVLSDWKDQSTDLEQLISDHVGATMMKEKPPAYKTVRDNVVQYCLVSKAVQGQADLVELAAKQSGINLAFFIESNQKLINLPRPVPSGLCNSKDDSFSLSLAVGAILCNDAAASETTLRTLQSIGAPLDCRDRHGFTPAFWAAALGHVTALRFLLNEAKCAASVKSHSGLTLAHVCCAHCSSESAACSTLQLIARRGGSLDGPDKAGKTPAQYLAERKFLLPLRFLAGNRGCSAQRALLPHQGISLLGFAVQEGWESEVRARLVSMRREDLQRQRHQCEQMLPQLLELAVKANQRCLLKMLFVLTLECCPTESVQRLTTAAAKHRDGKILALLTNQFGVDIDWIDPDDGDTLLTRATRQGHVDQVELLLRSGANPDRLNSAGQSAESLTTQSAVNESLFRRLVELLDSARPELWPEPKKPLVGNPQDSSTKSASKANLKISERQVVLPVASFCGNATFSYRVVEYIVTFENPINLFRMSRRGELPVLTEVLTDLRLRVTPQTRLSVRAVTNSVNYEVASQSSEDATVSADWPDIEFAVGINEAKLRELLCQLNHLLGNSSGFRNQSFTETFTVTVTAL